MEIKPAVRMQKKAAHFLSEQQEAIRELTAAGKPVINLGRGNPDQPTFQPIRESLKVAVDRPGNGGYPPYGGKRALKQEIIKFYQSEYGVALEEDEVTIFSGSLAALTALPMTLVNTGDGVLVPNPGFFGYQTGVRMAGGEVIDLPLLAVNDYLPDYRKLDEADLAKAKLMFLNYPHNPTGAGATPAFFNETVKFAKAHDLVVVHDFAYADISFGKRAPSFLQTPGAKEVGVEIYTMSKLFNMAGWRLAFAVGNRQVIKLLADYVQSSVGGTFGAVQDSVIENLNHQEKARDALRELYAKRRQAVLDVLRAGGVEVLPSAGTFFLWLKLPVGVDDQAFARLLLADEQVALVPGSVFGTAGAGALRLSLVADEETLVAGAKRLVNYLNKHSLLQKN